MNKIVYILLLMPLALGAQTPEFDNIVNQLQRTVPELQAVSTEAAARQTTLKAENYLDGPSVEFEYKFPQIRGVENRWGVEVSQGFEWPGLYSARSKALKKASTAADALISASTADFQRQVRLQLVELVAAHKQLALLQELSENADELARLADFQLEQSHITILDQRKARLEALALREEVAQTWGEIAALEQQLGKQTYGIEGLERVTEYPMVELQPLENYLNQTTAAQASAAYDAVLAHAAEHDARLSRLPGFSVGYLHDFEEGIHFNGFKVGLELPSWGAGKQLKAQQLEAETANLQLKQAQNARRQEIMAAYDELQHLLPLMKEYEQILGADDYLPLLRRSLDVGQITMAQFFTDQNWYLQARLTYLTLQARYYALLLSL